MLELRLVLILCNLYGQTLQFTLLLTDLELKCHKVQSNCGSYFMVFNQLDDAITSDLSVHVSNHRILYNLRNKCWVKHIHAGNCVYDSAP